ncbi:hypothetical protein EVAR_22584_1 [Eumeta japonica]|uniref:Uncharacterized protein n=1 Tax=Eumeta variegata TaxID=151549 RepID=A0A4C1U7M7_EUMVA|nr:hypothetical protein EVAR_22584_1 [Eumeta japonica]
MKPGFVNTIRNLNRSPCNGRKDQSKGRRRNGIMATWDSEGLLIDYLPRDYYYEWPILLQFMGQARAVVREATWEVIARRYFYKTIHLSTARVSRQALKDTGFSEIDHHPTAQI